MCMCCICYSLQSTPNQSQQQALINKSNDDLRRKRPETTRPNHILLFTIINPFYPITVVSTLQEFIYISYTFLRFFCSCLIYIFIFSSLFIVVFHCCCCLLWVLVHKSYYIFSVYCVKNAELGV